MTVDLTKERLEKGLSIRQAAAEMHIGAMTLQRAESGETVHPANAKTIADFYGYKPTEIWPLDQKATAA